MRIGHERTTRAYNRSAALSVDCAIIPLNLVYLGNSTAGPTAPRASIPAFTEILDDNPTLDPEQCRNVLAIVLREAKRLNR